MGALDRFFNREMFQNEGEFVEYVNLCIITAFSALLYILHGVVFLLYAYNYFLIVTQAFGVFICITAFVVNLTRRMRATSIIMGALVCVSINIWAYMVDIGEGMRWYTVLALCPLYFFSILKIRDKLALTVLIMAAFLSSTVISYYHEPVIKASNAALCNTMISLVIIISIALELIIYKYVYGKSDSELKRIGTVLSNIECGIVIVDAETHEMLDINQSAERMYEGSKGNIIGKKCHKLICPAAEGACPVSDKNEEVHRSERVLIKANGKTIPIIKSVAKIWYNDRPALLESFTDITGLKEAEEKLRILKITEQTNQAKSDFLSKMSHEMRTPMNAIIGMAKIAEGTDDTNKLKYCLSIIDVSATHLLGLINDILDMSKIEAGKLEIDSAPLHIEKILMKVSGIMIEQAERKNIDLNIFAGSGTDAQYIGDELRLTQVITNLISNAVKFTPGGGKVRLSAEEAQKEAGFSVFRFTVSDTGIGIKKEQYAKLFNAFEQADGSIARQYGGTGLGLAISKSIVEKMGGKIWIESEPGKGSIFSFEVRLKRAEPQNEKDIFIPPTKILIVDSDAEARAYLGSIGKRYGITVDEAESIETMAAGIKLANETMAPYDTIFLTYEMTDTDGIKTLNNLTEPPDKASIIFVTSLHTWEMIESTAHNAGFTRFISKPLFPSAVIDSINSVIGRIPTSLETVPAGAKAMPDFSGSTILLAEDVEINREIFIALLEGTNIKIDTAENGMEVVQKFKDDPDRYSVIIMDIQMPDMNGYQATEVIRSLDLNRARNIPIIAMTADAFKEDITRCLACGMNGHLKKPIEMERVMETLSLYCSA